MKRFLFQFRRALLGMAITTAGIGLTGLAVPAASAAAEATVLRLIPKVRVQSDTVYLQDMARIETVDADHRQYLAKIPVGRVPIPGQWRQISRNYVELKLRQYDIDTNRVRIEGPEKVRVCRAAVNADPAVIQQSVADFLKSHAPWADAELNIGPVKITSDTVLPTGRIEYSVLPPRQGPYTGTVPLVIMARVNSDFEKRINARVEVSAFKRVVRARLPIGRLKPITAADLETVRVDIGQLPLDPVTDIEEVIGKRARSNIMAHSVLQSEQIEFPPVVKRGDMVLIVAQSGGLRITTIGEVRSSGRPGEVVKVVNVDSNKTVVARVVDKHTVQVDF